MRAQPAYRRADAWARWGATVALGALVVAGCSGDAPDDEVVASGTPVPEISAPGSTEGPDGVDAPSVEPQHPTSAFVATAVGASVDVYDVPGGGEVSQTVAARDVLTVPDQTPLTFLVESRTENWIQVHLPVRPNGTTGWVEASEVTLIETDMRVEIELDEFMLRVFQGEDEVLATEIGVGRGDRPTPGGVYYIRELLAPPNPDGAYGPYAYGLSGYSPVLDTFNGGDAVIGIHGTNEPDSIGTLASSGCIRMANDVITDLVTEIGLPLGAPVYISEGDVDA